MFVIGPHHRRAFEREARLSLIAQAVARLTEQGFEARYDDTSRELTAKGKGDGPEALLFDRDLALVGRRRASGATTRFQPLEGGVGQRSISPSGAVTEVQIESDGDRVRLRHSGVGEHAFQYDRLGRPTAITYPSGASYLVDWGSSNAPTRIVDRLGAEWTWERDDASGQVSAMHDPLGRSIRFEADTHGLPTKLIDAAGRTTTFVTDGQRLLVTPDSGPKSVFSMTEGNVVEARWGELEGVRYKLDDQDNIVRAENVQSEDFVAFRRDNAGRILQESSPRADVQLAYDESGRLLSIQGGHESEIGYEYDVDGRVAAVSAWDGYRITLQWNGDDALIGLHYPGGVIEERTPHPNGRVATLEVHQGNGRTVVRQEYSYDAEERLVALAEALPAPRSRRYSYDAESHVVAENDASTNQPLRRWTYDLKGNLVSENAAIFELAEDDRPLAVGGRRIVWNEQGCATHVPSMGTHPGAELEFGDSQLLHRARATNGAAVSFSYDPVGRRTSKGEGRQHTLFRWCRHQVLREASVDALGESVVREWLYLPEAYAPIAMRQQRSGTTAIFSVHQDSRGAVIAMLDSAGSPVWHGQYETFGECRVTIDIVAQPWRLHGQYFDSETELHYNQARYYSPALRTYLSRDPRWLEWEATNYSYARNDPWNGVDPTGGLAFLLPMAIGAVVGGVIGGVAAAATGGNVLAGIAGGALGGAVGAIPGAGLAIAALAGAIGSVVTDITTALATGSSICVPCLLKSALIGGASGVLGAVAGKLFSRLVRAAKPLIGRAATVLRGVTNRIGSQASPSKFARSLQGSGNYPGVDKFRDIVLKKGTIVYGGYPGQSHFYTTASAVRRAKGAAAKLFGGLQVSPHPIKGYRPGIMAYEVTEDIPAAFGSTLRNPQHGSGGLPQIVIKDFSKFLKPIKPIPLK